MKHLNFSENKLTPSKRKKAEDVKRRQEIVLKQIKKSGSMTMSEILKKIPGSTVSSIGHMIKIGLLRQNNTGLRNKHGNIIYSYSFANSKSKDKPKPREFAFYDIFPVYIPYTTSKPRIIRFENS